MRPGVRMRQPRCRAGSSRPDDGWCDDPGDRNYNRPVRLPYPASHEAMWRDDHLYDVVVVLGHNDGPRRRGVGSAIFFHLADPRRRPTAGCIAVSRKDMREGAGAVRTAHPDEGVVDVRPSGSCALAEDRRADPDMRGAEGDRGFEIAAHAHAELRQAVALGDLGQQREMRRRLLIGRRDAHEARRSARP